MISFINRGGMAELWTVDKPGETMPLVMKIPLVQEGDDPTAIVGFEMEQMILPRLTGPHVPKVFASAGFDRQPYLVMERIEGTSLLPKLKALPLPNLSASCPARSVLMEAPIPMPVPITPWASAKCPDLRVASATTNETRTPRMAAEIPSSVCTATKRYSSWM